MDPNDFTHLPVCRLLHASRDADMRYAVTTGLAWLGGPKTQRMAVTWLVEHPDVDLATLSRLPERVRAYVTAARS